MINFYAITKAVEDQLNQYIEDQSLRVDYVIKRNRKQNTNKQMASKGWIGVYRNKLTYTPIASGGRYNSEIEIRIELQMADFTSEERCEERLDELEKFVLDALNADITLGGYVGMINEFDIDYDDNYADVQKVYYQTATMIITCEVTTR